MQLIHKLAKGRFSLPLQLDVFASTPGALGALLAQLRPLLHRHPAATLAGDDDVLDAGDGLELTVAALHTTVAFRLADVAADTREPLAADYRATLSGTAEGELVTVREMPLQLSTIVTVGADEGADETITV
jgi:hypothetical protein